MWVSASTNQPARRSVKIGLNNITSSDSVILFFTRNSWSKSEFFFRWVGLLSLNDYSMVFFLNEVISKSRRPKSYVMPEGGKKQTLEAPCMISSLCYL